MISGMSYSKGIFYLSDRGIAHATVHQGEIVTHYFPIGLKGILFILQRLLLSLPFYLFVIAGILYILSLPAYSYLLLVFGYHFIFPTQLKKYHGAEHKVFSYKGRVHLVNQNQIADADIVNRNCSTNKVVTFFLGFLLSVGFVGGWYACLIAILMVFFLSKVWKWGDTQIIFPISAYLQRVITTKKPDELHLKVSILSFMTFQQKRSLTEKMVWEQYHQEQERIRQEEDRKRLEQLERERVLREKEEKQVVNE